MRGTGTPGATSNRQPAGARMAPLRTGRNFSPRWFVLSRVRSALASGDLAHTSIARPGRAPRRGDECSVGLRAPGTPHNAAEGPEGTGARPAGAGAQRSAQEGAQRPRLGRVPANPIGGGAGPPAPASCGWAHSYAPPLQVVVNPKRAEAGSRSHWVFGVPRIRDPAYRFRRFFLLRGWVNKGKRKGLGQYSLASTTSTIRVCGSPIRAGDASRDDHTSRRSKARKDSASLGPSNPSSMTT